MYNKGLTDCKKPKNENVAFFVVDIVFLKIFQTSNVGSMGSHSWRLFIAATTVISWRVLRVRVSFYLFLHKQFSIESLIMLTVSRRSV